MGIWDELRALGGEYGASLLDIYARRNFPYELRGAFAEWLEENNWDFDETNPSNAAHADGLLSILEGKLDSYCKEDKEDLMTQMRHRDIKSQFSEVFSGNPQYFVATVRDILNEERLLLNIELAKNCNTDLSSFSVNFDSKEMTTEFDKSTIITSLNLLNGKVEDIDALIKECRNKQEDFVIEYQNLLKKEQEINQASSMPDFPLLKEKIQKMRKYKEGMEKIVKNKLESLIKDRDNVMKHLLSIQTIIHNYSTQIQQELIAWKAMLQKSMSGAPNPYSLEEIQEWFENLTDILRHFYLLASQHKLLYDTLPIAKHGNEKELNQKLMKDIVDDLTSLIIQSFVVDKQPPQVLKTQTKFHVSVRLLVGAKLNLQMNCPEVSVSILSEPQCKQLIGGKSLEEVGASGVILNDKCVMEHNSDCSILKADFKNLQLKNIKRKDTKGQESVLEMKSALLFSAKLNICGGELLPVWAMSFPLVVVVHGNQIPNSEATIFWDNMFSLPSRVPFDVPESVTCDEILFALNARWTLSNEIKLKDDNLLFLKEKLLALSDSDFSGNKITWAWFNKNPIASGKSFTFWGWLFGAVEVVNKSLKNYWKQHCLELFISKEASQRKLLEMPVGTFLIRCSESEVGSVTIACCVESNGKKGIWHLQPWSSKDFQIRSLADRIFDFPILTHLYPDIPKEDKFEDLRSKEFPSACHGDRGYVDTEIVARIITTSSDQQLVPANSPSMDNFQQPMEYMSCQDTPSPQFDNLFDADVLDTTALTEFDFQKLLDATFYSPNQ